MDIIITQSHPEFIIRNKSDMEIELGILLLAIMGRMEGVNGNRLA